MPTNLARRFNIWHCMDRSIIGPMDRNRAVQNRTMLRAMTEDWLSISDAAIRLNVSEKAIRSRVKRHTLRCRKGNDGRLMVCLSDGPIDRSMDLDRSKTGLGPDRSIEGPLSSNQTMVPLSVMIDQQSRHDAEMAHRITEIQTIHLNLVNRLQAQTAMERSLWLERVDAAELRAERVEQRLDQVLDKLLTNQHQAINTVLDPVGQPSEADKEPFWRRLFGGSKRSKIRGE